MPRPRERGFSVLELVIALAIFGILLMVSGELQRELLAFDKGNVVEFFSHPELDAIVVRLRADVLDSSGFPSSFDHWEQTPTTLLLALSSTPPRTIVWDFQETGVVRRMEYEATTLVSDWTAHGAPSFVISSESLPDGKVAVRAVASTEHGERIVDRVFAPRVR